MLLRPDTRVCALTQSQPLHLAFEQQVVGRTAQPFCENRARLVFPSRGNEVFAPLPAPRGERRGTRNGLAVGLRGLVDALPAALR